MSYLLSKVWSRFVEYETPRLVKIHNRKVGLVSWLFTIKADQFRGILGMWLLGINL